MARGKKVKEAAQEASEVAVNSETIAFVRRVIEDEQLRAQVGRAIESSQRAYERVAKAKKPAKLLEDKELHSEAADALAAIRDVGLSLAEKGRKSARKQKRKSRKLLIALVGGGLAVVGSEGLRSKVLDTLFGAEEEFEYTPPAAPPTATPPAAPPAATPPPPTAADAA
jgi:hypothetical protein